MLDKYIAYFVFSLSLIGGGYLLYHKIKDSGYKEAEDKYTQQINEYRKDIEVKKAEVEVLSNFLDNKRYSDTQQLNENLDAIIKEFRRTGKTTTIIKEGKCSPSQDFVDTWNNISEKASNVKTTNPK
jgi:23S rRNA pseudoU1915 N3-methylase RlmH